MITRRNFLRAGGIVVAGGMATLYFGRHALRRTAYEFAAGPSSLTLITNFRPDFVFETQPDNTVQMTMVKAEMGQGIFTGLAMLAAEELDVSLEQIAVAPTNTGRADMIDRAGTGGSGTTRGLYVPVREVAATYREMLKTAAANQWGVDVADVETADGFVSAGSNRMSYYDVSQSTTEWAIPDTPELRPRSGFKYVGTEVPRIDLTPKVMGSPIFGVDATVEGMLHANVLKCPYIGGTVTGIDAEAARAVPGVVDVVELDDLIAVVATDRYAAEMGKRALNATWDVPTVWQQSDVDQLTTVQDSGGVSLQKEGNVGNALDRDGGTLVEADYRVATAVHAHMEPNSAIVDVREDSAMVITATQGGGMVHGEVLDALGFEAEQVDFRETYLGGGFGRRFALNPAADAARLSRAVGRPVQVIWDRETEFLCGVVRPPSHHRFRGRLDENGRAVAVSHVMASADQGLGLVPLPVSLRPILGADIISAAHGARVFYEIENREAKIQHVELPFTTGIWRGVGIHPNGFAGESFIDELAVAAGQDPIDFRLDHLSSDNPLQRRYIEMLNRIRYESGWDTPPPAGVGRGVAIIEDRHTIAASVIEVAVGDDASVQVLRVTSAIDPGIIVNPDGVRQQVEGGVMMGLSAALYEESVLVDGQFSASNYHTYRMATLADTPEVNVVLMEGSDEITGVGEPPIAPIAPAIANAIDDATGHRVRNMPLQPALAAILSD